MHNTNDIVELLLEDIEFQPTPLANILKEAANEIQKLREKVADLEAELEILEHSGGYGV